MLRPLTRVLWPDRLLIQELGSDAALRGHDQQELGVWRFWGSGDAVRSQQESRRAFRRDSELS
jgi:hypothetical protein